jgi:Sporulation and spore germination
MSERFDRAIKGGPLLYAGLVIVTIAMVAGAYLWWRASVQDMGAGQQSDAQARSVLVQLSHRDEPLPVTLYSPSDGMLAPVPAAIKRQPDTQAQARQALIALFTDQRSSQAAVLKDLKLHEFYLDASGTAYVDLAPNQQMQLKASLGEELLALYAVVDTLTLNFEEIKQVMFLLDGKEARTLAGHVDLSIKFTKRTDLVRQ